jgi:MFS family permease
VRTLQITIAWFAVFTFLSGFTQTYYQLLTCRALMGFGFGGEWAAGAVLMGEVIRAQHRGKAVGTVQSGWPIGWGVAAILSTILFSLLPQETAWRVLFWIGLMPAFMILFVRRFVDEPHLFKAAREKTATGGHRQIWLEIFSPEIIKTTILTSLLTTGAQGGYYALFTWLPTYLKAKALRNRQRRLHRRRHHRFIYWFACRRAFGRPHWKARKFPALCCLLTHHRRRLHAVARR